MTRDSFNPFTITVTLQSVFVPKFIFFYAMFHCVWKAATTTVVEEEEEMVEGAAQIHCPLQVIIT